MVKYWYIFIVYTILYILYNVLFCDELYSLVLEIGYNFPLHEIRRRYLNIKSQTPSHCFHGRTIRRLCVNGLKYTIQNYFTITANM